MKKPKPTPPPQDKPDWHTLSNEALFRALIPGWKPEAEK